MVSGTGHKTTFVEPIASRFATEPNHLSHMTFSRAAAAAVSIWIRGNARCARLTLSPSSPLREALPWGASGSFECAATAAFRRAKAAGTSSASRALGAVPLCPIILISVTATSPNGVMAAWNLVSHLTDMSASLLV